MRWIGWFLLCLAIACAVAGGEERLTRLFSNDFDFWDCDWSPDGRYLALAGKYHSQSAEQARVWLYAIGAEKPVLWTNTNEFCDDWPRWSPNGKYLALVRRELSDGRRTCLWWKDVATGAGRRLTKGPDDRQPSWSPDGSAIVFRRGLGLQESVLAVFEVASGRVNILPISPGLLGEPCWGPDGAIYYTRYRLVKRETVVGGKTYSVQVIAGGRLWRFLTATGKDEPLSTAELDQRMPSVSPDGKWLAYYGQKKNTGQVSSIPDPDQWALFLRDLAGTADREIVSNVALTGGPPVWSPDGKTLTFYSLRLKMPALWTYTVTELSK
ncbi:MAG: hypothetical protein ACM3ZC_07550 [Bacteroidota bacterium]